jgi:hypothetical protein
LAEENGRSFLDSIFSEARGGGRETRMRSERAWFLDRRERRANDESSPFSTLGENGRGFDATTSSLFLTVPSAYSN